MNPTTNREAFEREFGAYTGWGAPYLASRWDAERQRYYGTTIHDAHSMYLAGIAHAQQQAESSEVRAVVEAARDLRRAWRSGHLPFVCEQARNCLFHAVDALESKETP
jgi:hypothetical protein